MAKVKIIYGTGGGNTELVCEKVAEVLEAAGNQIEMVRVKGAGPEVLSQKSLPGDSRGKAAHTQGNTGASGLAGTEEVLIFACPTYGHGQLEPYFAKFFKKIQDVDLKGRKCAVITLGDAKYEMDYFLESGKILTEFLEKMEAEILQDSLKIAMTPVPRLDNMVENWAKELAGKLG